ncbi:MAG: DNA-3-methyladenine glycosylase 2 family protein [Eubacteriaceae bacterium]|nr:DNA-3-methyladenine glycosylase 2 family protein [Eubacteriaceae bacterium]
MSYTVFAKAGDTIIENLTDFELSRIFDCGQCFRFARSCENQWTGAAFSRKLTALQTGDRLILKDTSLADFYDIWEGFFDLKCDYSLIREAISTDETINEAIKKGYGIRILNQDTWECLISFIISQNNNIPRIKKIIEALCERYGEDMGGIKAFPTPQALAAVCVEELHSLGTGYRDEYISLAARSVAEGRLDLNKLNAMETPEARSTLLSLKGIGGKVADCILLFGMGRKEVCPHDVWVKRIFAEKYGITAVTEKKGYELAKGKWGQYAGVAQQYLFYSERGFS